MKVQTNRINIVMKKYERPTTTNVAIGTDSIIAASLPLGNNDITVPAEDAKSKMIDILMFEEMEEEEE